MKGGQLMINTSLKIFSDNVSNLHDVSKDTSVNPIVYMTASTKQCFSFDDIKRDFTKNNKISQQPCSADALFVNDKGDYIAFIEFKNGTLGTKEVFKIYEKMYCCSIILSNIIKKPTDFIKDNIDFYIVYNGEKNSVGITPSKSRDVIAKSVYRLAKKNMVDFNVEQFERFLYRKVYTYTEKEFEQEFVKNYC